MKLPDYLSEGLKIVFCGTAAGDLSAARGHYYSHPRNDFWRCLHQAGFTPVLLRPHDDFRVLQFGVGLTDISKTGQGVDRGLSTSDFDVKGFLRKVEILTPGWVAFNGKKAAEIVSRHLGHGRSVALGLQPWRLGTSRLFVLPSTSGGNADPRNLGGKPTKVAWFRELAALLEP